MWLFDRLIRYLADRRLRKQRRDAYLSFLQLPPEIRSDIRWRDDTEPRLTNSDRSRLRLG